MFGSSLVRPPRERFALVLLAVGSASLLHGCSIPIETPSLRLMTQDWSQECRCSTDVNATLDTLARDSEAEIGLRTSVTRSAPGEYWRDLMVDLESRAPADIILVPHDRFGALVDADRIVALDEELAESPSLVDSLPTASSSSFRIEGKLYAIPLGPDGLLSGVGFAVTRTASDRGLLADALEWIGRARLRLTHPGRPEVVAADLRLDAETLDEGQELVLSARIENSGLATAEDVPVLFRLDAERVLGERRIDELAAGDSQTVTLETEAPKVGVHVWSAIANPSGDIAEASLCNNETAHEKWVGSLSGTEAAPKLLVNPVQLQKNAFQSRSQFDKFVRVASDGTDYLVVWKRQVTTSKAWPKQRLMGARVSAAGTVLGVKGFQITQKAGWYDTFNVTYDGARYVVVWEDLPGRAKPAGNYTVDPYGSIKAARISKAGVVLDTVPIVVEAAPCTACPAGWSVNKHEVPDIASTGTGSIVVYRSGIYGKTNYQEALFAKLLTQGGKVQPAKFKVTDLDSSLAPAGFLSLAFNDKQNEGFVLFDASDFTTTPHQEKVTGVWLKQVPTGFQSSTPQTLTKQPRLKWWLDDPATTAGPNGGYLGVFENSKNKTSAGDPDIHGGIAGNFSAKSFSYKGALVKGQRKLNPDVAYDGKNYTLAFVDVVACGKSHVGAVRITPQGQAGPSTVYPKTIRVEEVAVAFSKTNGLIAYTQEMTGLPNPPSYEFGVFFILIDKS